MNNDKTLYEILGFSKNGYNDNGEKVSFESIDRAKNRLLYGEMGSDSVPFWMRDDINKAYSILSNPTSRREYDESLLTHNVSYSSNDTNITEAPVVIEPTEAEQSIVEPQEERTVDETNEEEYDEAVVDLNDYYPSLEATPEEVTSEEATPEEVTPEEATPEEVTPEEVTPEEVTPEEVTPEEATPEEAPVAEETSEEVTPVEPKSVEPKPEKADLIPIEYKEKNKKGKKPYTKAMKGLKYFSWISLLGPFGYFIAKKQINAREITKVMTEESKLIQEYNETLDSQINELLARPHNNYNLEIARLRYANQITLIQKRLEHKEKEKIKFGGYTKFKLEYMALKQQLERATQRLRTIEGKIEDYNKNKVRNPLSNALNEKLYEQTKEANQAKNEKKINVYKKLSIRANTIQKLRDFSVKRLKSTRTSMGKMQDGFIKVYDVSKSVLNNLFKKNDSLDVLKVEPKEEKGRTK